MNKATKKECKKLAKQIAKRQKSGIKVDRKTTALNRLRVICTE